jgi:hypothetical protein
MLGGYGRRCWGVADECRWIIIFVAIVIGALCIGGYVFAPKGDNQTYFVHVLD